jgi:hypothetical protein
MNLSLQDLQAEAATTGFPLETRMAPVAGETGEPCHQKILAVTIRSFSDNLCLY